jgi:pimeloyl-ACP methyl ester carboxylesterase
MDKQVADVVATGKRINVLQWILRIGIGLVALVAASSAVLLVMFFSWRADIVGQREADPDRRIVTTAMGDIEFAVVADGVPLLSLHGTPGGYDQGLVGIRAIPGNAPENTMTIAVSRPGYRGTPQSSGATFEEQADLFAALLDELGVERAVVFAASGGGYAGLQFAIRHPERTLGLILYAPEVAFQVPVGFGPGDSLADTKTQVFITELGMWVLGARGASLLINDFDAGDSAQVSMVTATLESSIPWGGRDPGRLNDLAQRMDPAIDDWPLEQISALTLILHGNADRNSSYETSREAASRIPNAELVTFEGGDHYIIVTRRQEVEGRIRLFTQAVASGAVER